MSRESHYDPADGEFVDFETLDDWQARDVAKDAEISKLRGIVDAVDRRMTCAEEVKESADDVLFGLLRDWDEIKLKEGV
jgi:hypothetical protein